MKPDTRKQGTTSPMPSMSCAECQQQLPDLFATRDHIFADDSLRQRHLETCATCSALVRDLEFIAKQAALLLRPIEEEPSDKVWKKIQEEIAVKQGYSSKGGMFSSVSLSTKSHRNPVKV